MDHVGQVAEGPLALAGQARGVGRGALPGGGGAAGGQCPRRGLAQRALELVRCQVRVLAHLQGGHRVQPQAPGPGGGLGGGLDLPGPLFGIGLQLEHAEQVPEHGPDIPAGAVGRPRPVLCPQVISEGEQPVIFDRGEPHGLLVPESRDFPHGNRRCHQGCPSHGSVDSG